jgi:hypothetical protein
VFAEGQRCFEAEQLIQSGLLTEAQIVGVNRDSAIVDACRTLYPFGRFICGDWISCFHTLVAKGVDPVAVYLDTTAKANCSSTAVRAAASTINLLAERVRLGEAGPALVVVNVIRKHAGSEHAVLPDTFIKLLGPKIKVANRPLIHEPRQACYTYTQDTDKPFIDQTLMSSYLFLVGRDRPD